MNNLWHKLIITVLTFIIGVSVASAYLSKRKVLPTLFSQLSFQLLAKNEHLPTPPTWKRVEVNRGFAFYLPENINLLSDERSEEAAWGSIYADERLSLFVEYISWDESFVKEYLLKQAEYHKEIMNVAGKKVKLESWRLAEPDEEKNYSVEARVYGLGDGKMRFIVRGLCREGTDVKTVRRIIQSIEISSMRRDV